MTGEDFKALLERCRTSFQQACEAGWLDAADAQRLAGVEHAIPADLFLDQATRPLVAALFGGTGVGKSSLLNRLAGTEIARTGAERPTSREATLYVHESVALADLPADLPLARVRIFRHSCDAQRQVLWLDAPDVDSTAQDNRRAALAWLPHVDLICYVVTPERYRDDVGWRLLRARGYKHAWVFIVNRWDEGHPRQVEDLRGILRTAGFDDPLILCTCCRPGRPLPSEDQFEILRAKLEQILRSHGIAELTRLGYRARLLDLRSVLAAAETKLGQAETWEEIAAAAQAAWEKTEDTIRLGLSWGLRTAAERVAASGSWLATLRRGLTSAVLSNAPTRTDEPEGQALGVSTVLDELWDEWAQAKVAAWSDTVELLAGRAGLVPSALRARLGEATASCAEVVKASLEEAVRGALARPGTALGRAARRVTGFLMAFLPAAALLWVAWRVVHGYYLAGTRGEPFLGVDFAVHSALLVVLAWALPFTADRLLRPSAVRIAHLGLQAGLDAGLAGIKERLVGALERAAADAKRHRDELRALQAKVNGLLVCTPAARDPAISRMVVQTTEAPRL